MPSLRLRLALILVLVALASVATAQVTTFVQISDPHLGRSLPYEPADKAAWNAAVASLIRDCNEVLKPALVVATGDLVSFAAEDNFAAYKQAMGALQAPLLNVPGNHDYQGEGTGAKFAAAIGPLHQTKLVAGLYFVGLNTISLLGKADPTAELAWLRDALATPEAVGARQRIVCGHYPAYEDDRRHTGGVWTREGFQILGATREGFLQALRLGQADLYLSGHIHGDWDEVCLVAGTRHLVTGSASSGAYRVVVVDGTNTGTRTTGPGRWPLVVITAPAPYVSGSSARSKGLVQVRAKVFAPAAPAAVSCRVDEMAPTAMALGDDGLYSAPLDCSTLQVGLRKLTVAATAADGQAGQTQISFVVTK